MNRAAVALVPSRSPPPLSLSLSLSVCLLDLVPSLSTNAKLSAFGLEAELKQDSRWRRNGTLAEFYFKERERERERETERKRSLQDVSPPRVSIQGGIPVAEVTSRRESIVLPAMTTVTRQRQPHFLISLIPLPLSLSLSLSLSLCGTVQVRDGNFSSRWSARRSSRPLMTRARAGRGASRVPPSSRKNFPGTHSLHHEHRRAHHFAARTCQKYRTVFSRWRHSEKGSTPRRLSDPHRRATD